MLIVMIILQQGTIAGIVATDEFTVAKVKDYTAAETQNKWKHHLKQLVRLYNME